jgi:CheY-like chemotaxis protein
MSTGEPRREAHAERGQLIPLQRPSRIRGERAAPAQPRRPRRSAPVLLPQWQSAAMPGPTDAQPTTDGALALLEQPEIERTPHPATARNAILIVEDDARMARLLRESLALEGEPEWDVQVAAEGRQALALAAATPPEVVLLDVLLPGLDGAEVYRRLRADKKTRGARILFLTAGTSFDLQRRGIDDGVLLRKPFDVRELAGIVRGLLAG